MDHRGPQPGDGIVWELAYGPARSPNDITVSQGRAPIFDPTTVEICQTGLAGFPDGVGTVVNGKCCASAARAFSRLTHKLIETPADCDLDATTHVTTFETGRRSRRLANIAARLHLSLCNETHTNAERIVKTGLPSVRCANETKLWRKQIPRGTNVRSSLRPSSSSEDERSSITSGPARNALCRFRYR